MLNKRLAAELGAVVCRGVKVIQNICERHEGDPMKKIKKDNLKEQAQVPEKKEEALSEEKPEKKEEALSGKKPEKKEEALSEEKTERVSEIKSDADEKEDPVEYYVDCVSCCTEWKTRIKPEKITACPFCGSGRLSVALANDNASRPEASAGKSYAREYNRPADLFEYSVEGSEVCIRKCNQNSLRFRKNLIVPETINGLPVTSVFKDAFKSCDKLVSVTLPEGITKIGISAFYGCENLKSIGLPESLESISSGAFYGCYSLESIELPKNVSFLGGRAFENCYGLKSITMPEKISDISVSLFYNCSKLESITLPEEIMTISKDAFSGCRALKKVVLPPYVTTIGKRAFYGCVSLSGVYIPETVRRIGVLAFYLCKDVTVYSHSLTFAEEYAKNEGLKFSTKAFIEYA